MITFNAAKAIFATSLLLAFSSHSFAQQQPVQASPSAARAKPSLPPSPVRTATGDRVPFPHYADKGRGWFWKETPPEVEEPPQEDPAPPPASPPAPPEPAGPKPFSSAWIKDNLPKYLEAAVDDPSPQNVSNYLYLQRLAMDSADRFSAIYQRVSTVDPVLDENRARPQWGPAADLVARRAEQAKEVLLKDVGKRFGIWFFFRSDCAPCHQQAPILHTFAVMNGFTVLPISVDGRDMPNNPWGRMVVDRGQATKLGVEGTPTMFMVSQTGDFHAISDSVIPVDELQRRVIEIAASTNSITEEQYASTRATGKQLLPSPASLAGAAQPVADSPRSVRDYLKAQLSQKR